MEAFTSEQVWQPRRKFRDWVKDNVEQGIDGHGKEVYYVPYPKLKGYWTHGRVAGILGSCDKDLDIGVIRHRFIRAVSVLTYVADGGRTWIEYLDRFYRTDIDDHSLPLRSHDIGASSAHTATLRQAPAPFDEDSEGLQTWSHFSEHQWKFLPLLFEQNGTVMDRLHHLRALDPRHIIPITIEKELSQRSGRGARVLKVKPHKDSGLPPDPIVLKEYLNDKDRYTREFMNERHTYTTIRNMRGTNMSKYFLHYYGCFIQGNKAVILIEYANQGSLLDFFKTNWFLPRTKEEAKDLWEDLGLLIKGLALLHSGGKHTSTIHQDIKPANIFVSKVGSNGNRFSFKFGDFGTCSVTPIAENGDTTGYDNGGTRMYSAPELCNIDSEVTMSGRVSWQADIWSFGCVLLDCGVWMALHERGRVDFRNERVEEIRSLKQESLSKAGYDGAFHDGEQVLSTIKRKTDEILSLDSPVAQLVGNMMEFIQQEMLRQDIVERLNAQQLQARFQNAINSQLNSSPRGVHRVPSQIDSQYPVSPRRTLTSIAHDNTVSGVGNNIPLRSATWVPQPGDRVIPQELVQPRPITRNSTVSYREVPHPSASTLNQPRLSAPRQQSPMDLDINTVETPTTAMTTRDANYSKTIQDVLEWIPKHKARQASMLRWLEQPLKQLRGRDQCFIYDNSKSMAPYWPEVKDTANALTYILKSVDPDGFETHMTNSGECLKQNDRKGLFNESGYFDQHRPRPEFGACPMEHILSNILERVIDKALAPISRLDRLRSRQIRGVSIYVFTNGVWEARRRRDGSNEGAGGVENAIKTAVDRLQAARKMRPFLSIQFISFGDNPEGRRRMSWLDDGIKATTGGWDIVDTTHHTESVEKMIIGAIREGMDDQQPVNAPGIETASSTSRD
ncbi:kinase-like domain-containing protein [Xylaria grammica]|nr:kinase-like domain-containing protein [Xylaria grammica]